MNKELVGGDINEQIDLVDLLSGICAVLDNISHLGGEYETSLLELLNERHSIGGVKLQILDLIFQNVRDASILAKFVTNSCIPTVYFNASVINDQVVLNSTRRFLGLSNVKSVSGIPVGEIDLF